MFMVQGLRFGVQSLGLGVYRLSNSVWGLGLTMQVR